VFLVLALALAALSHKNRAIYFRSPAPWIGGLVGALACAPHVYWLVRENFPPTKYVSGVRSAESVFDWLRSVVEFSFGTAGYAALALALLLAATRPSRKAICDGMWPVDSQRRTAAILFWTPLLLPMPVAAITGTRLLSLWSMPALGLLPVVLLMSPLIVVPRRAVVYTATLAMTISGVALAASPLVAWWHLSGVRDHAHHLRLLAKELESEWTRTTSQPLKFVGGPFVLANPISFYLPEQPRPYYMVELRFHVEHYLKYLAPWADMESIMREGVAIACPTSDDSCLLAMNSILSLAPHTRPREVVLRRRWLDFEAPSERFTIAIVPPSAKP
jgi:hypothetical protein